MELGGLLGGEFEEVTNAEFPGLGEDGVVDVGDVAYQLHLMAKILEPADQEVIGEIGVRVAEMGGVVRGDTADVHLHLVSRFERDDLPAGRVEELHVGHGRPPEVEVMRSSLRRGDTAENGDAPGGAPPAGIEPATHGLGNRRSIH